MKKLFALVLWAFLLPTIFFFGNLGINNKLAFAQDRIITLPNKINSQNNSSSTISVTNTFQSIFVASTGDVGRTGCTVQNTGTNAMYVYFGPIANATIAASVKLVAGQAVTCSVDNIVLRQQVSITGTATETFYAAEQ